MIGHEGLFIGKHSTKINIIFDFLTLLLLPELLQYLVCFKASKASKASFASAFIVLGDQCKINETDYFRVHIHENLKKKKNESKV